MPSLKGGNTQNSKGKESLTLAISIILIQRSVLLQKTSTEKHATSIQMNTTMVLSSEHVSKTASHREISTTETKRSSMLVDYSRHRADTRTAEASSASLMKLLGPSRSNSNSSNPSVATTPRYPPSSRIWETINTACDILNVPDDKAGKIDMGHKLPQKATPSTTTTCTSAGNTTIARTKKSKSSLSNSSKSSSSSRPVWELGESVLNIHDQDSSDDESSSNDDSETETDLESEIPSDNESCLSSTWSDVDDSGTIASHLDDNVVEDDDDSSVVSFQIRKQRQQEGVSRVPNDISVEKEGASKRLQKNLASLLNIDDEENPKPKKDKEDLSLASCSQHTTSSGKTKTLESMLDAVSKRTKLSQTDMLGVSPDLEASVDLSVWGGSVIGTEKVVQKESAKSLLKRLSGRSLKGLASSKSEASERQTRSNRNVSSARDFMLDGSARGTSIRRLGVSSSRERMSGSSGRRSNSHRRLLPSRAHSASALPSSSSANGGNSDHPRTNRTMLSSGDAERDRRKANRRRTTNTRSTARSSSAKSLMTNTTRDTNMAAPGDNNRNDKNFPTRGVRKTNSSSILELGKAMGISTGRLRQRTSTPSAPRR